MSNLLTGESEDSKRRMQMIYASQGRRDVKVATYNLFSSLSSLLVSLGIFIDNIQSLGLPLGVLKIYYDFLPFYARRVEQDVFSQKNKIELQAVPRHGRSRLSFLLPDIMEGKCHTQSFCEKLKDFVAPLEGEQRHCMEKSLGIREGIFFWLHVLVLACVCRR